MPFTVHVRLIVPWMSWRMNLPHRIWLYGVGAITSVDQTLKIKRFIGLNKLRISATVLAKYK